MKSSRPPHEGPLGAAPNGGRGAAVCDHIVQFYDTEDFLCDTVAGFLREGLSAGQPLVVIGRAERCVAFADRLGEGGLDVERARRAGELTLVDARELLDRVMVDAMPDPARFQSAVGGVLERSLRGRDGARVRAYGEMVDVLWRDGLTTAAIRLEELWNQLAERYAFSLLCAYSMGHFYAESHSAPFREICRHHTRVALPESQARAVDEAARAREISELQQRARALAHEVDQRKKLERALRTALAERGRSEAELRAAKTEADRASRAKSQFLTVMSHELRTPLNAIIGYHELLSSEIGGPVTERQREYLSRLRTGADQLVQLVDQVLSLSRIEAGREELRAEPVDVGSLVAEAAAMVEPTLRSKALTLDVRLPEQPVTWLTDLAKLRQILLNLLSNAAKFTARGGVTLEAAAGAELVLRVTDTGPGIAGEDLERIFAPFIQIDSSTTRAHGGTGLGLPVSRDLARLLGGDIAVESRLGSGSTFTVRLPNAG